MKKKKGMISNMIDSFKGYPNNYIFGQIVENKYVDFS